MADAEKHVVPASGDLESGASIWIIDPHPIVRSGLRIQLEAQGYSVAFEGPDLTESLLRTVKDRPPNFALIDFEYSTKIISDLKLRSPSTSLIVFSGSAEIAQISKAFAAGADGYILKNIAPAALIKSLHLVAQGEKVFPSVLTGFLSSLKAQLPNPVAQPRKVGDVELTEREVCILRGLAHGHSNKIIATTLKVTEATVKVNLKTVLRKLRLTNRTQAAIWAVRHDLSQEGSAVSDSANEPLVSEAVRLSD